MHLVSAGLLVAVAENNLFLLNYRKHKYINHSQKPLYLLYMGKRTLATLLREALFKKSPFPICKNPTHTLRGQTLQFSLRLTNQTVAPNARMVKAR